MDDPNTSTLRKTVDNFSNNLDRPVSGIGAMIRSSGNASDTIKKNLKTIAQTDKKIAKQANKFLQKKRADRLDALISEAEEAEKRKPTQPKMDQLSDQKPTP